MISPVSYITALGCIDIEVWNSTRNLQEPIYNVGQQLVFTCPDEFVFPGGETEITIECMKDLQWDRSLPISGCDGMYECSMGN